jgi:hypothetical protein
MGAAAVRITVLAMLLVCGAFSSTAVAGEEIDPIGTITGVISTITSQTTIASDLTGPTTVASDVTGSATGDSAGSSVIGTLETTVGGGTEGGSGTADGSSGTTDSSRSGQPSADGRRSTSNGSARTRFDRLPRRYEILLERIEFGHKVRVSIARLRALLASATPEARARILHLLRSEIRRLKRNGLTRRERAAVRRLHRLLRVLSESSPSRAAAPASLGRLAGAGVASANATGTAGTSAGGAGSLSGTAEQPFTGGPEGPGLNVLGISPGPPLDGVNWLWFVLSILAGILAGVAVTAISLGLLARSPRGPD